VRALLHRPAGGVVDMDDAPRRMAALAGQVKALALAGIEGHAQFGEPQDRGGRILDDELDGAAVVEARARHHRVLDVAFEGVAFLEHRGDAALRPGGRARRDVALRQHDDAVTVGEIERAGQPGRAGAGDDDVIVVRFRGWGALSHGGPARWSCVLRLRSA
jgi:hypothetical protein